MGEFWYFDTDAVTVNLEDLRALLRTVGGLRVASESEGEG